MAAGRHGMGKAVFLAVTWLMCAGVCAQPAAPATEDSVFRMTLEDINVCLEALSETEEVLADRDAARAKVQIVREILGRARSRAGKPVRRHVPGAFAGNLAAGPYLQQVTGNSVLIRWTAVQSGTVVRYGPGAQLTSTVRASRLPWPRWMYEAQLSGLEAGREYTYSIRIGGSEVQGTFRAAPAGDAPFNFAVWGDSQCYPDVFSGVVAQMVRHTIDLAVCTGDAVEEGLTDGDYYRQLFQPARELLRNALLVAAVGNHELLGDPSLSRRRRLIRIPNPDKAFFAMTYANCRFIVLDSNEKGLFKGPQLDWLKRELASDACTKARFRFLLLHHAPFCWDWYGGEPKVQQVIVPLAEKNKIDVMFGGHFHCYERGARPANGHHTWYVVSGGGAGFFTDRNGPGHHERDFMTKHEWKHHFVLVSVDAAGLKARAIDDKGRTIDKFEIERAGTARPSSPLPTRAGGKALPARGSAPAQPVLPTDYSRFCTMSAADRGAAVAALDQCRKAIGREKPVVADRLARVAGVLEDARDLARQGTWAGPVERTAHLVPRLVNRGVHYRLKPSEEADAAVRDVLDKIGHGRLKGTYEAKGLCLPMGRQHWILVDSIAAK